MNFFYRFVSPVLLILLVAALWTPSSVMPQNEEDKYGYIVVKQIFDSYDKVQSLSKQIKEETDTYSSKSEQMQSNLIAQLEEYKVKQGMLSEDANKQRQLEIRNLEKELYATIEEGKKKVQQLQRTGMNPILVELNQVVKNYAQKNGYTFIFKKASMAYIDERYDITDDIVKELNKN